MAECQHRGPGLVCSAALLAVVAAASIASLTAPAVASAEDRPDLLVADFEVNGYGDWKVEGEAFGPAPAEGTLPHQMEVSGYLGERLVNSYHGGDDTTGRLISRPLRIERKFINFLIGGGKHPDRACINLLVDGRVARTATGPNDRPGGSERLEWASWDVGDLQGREASIEIIDRQTGGWGHINIDHIVQSDRRRAAEPAERRLVVEKRYLHLPVENGAPKRRMRFIVEHRTAREFDIELAGREPSFWVFADVSALAGKELTIAVDRVESGSRVLEAIRASDELPGADTLYREQYRPQFHFSSRRGWLNDPNGLVYCDGEYHLYYQHNPYGWSWGNMHWGHAVSRDLVHWTELPVAIYPRQYGDWVFSGSAVVDERNTSGFRAGGEPLIVAAYTSTGRGECIAYSNDRGRTFTEYAGNPVVRHAGRDPKLIWYAPGDHWVMAVYDEYDGRRWIAFHTSPDLKRWTFQSRTEGYFECPEIFELPLDGDANRRRWVVYAADGDYAVGHFDGKSFTPEHEGKYRFNHGDCFYASQTFNNLPPEDGRRVQIAWGRVGRKEMPFNQMMNFPVELSLRTTDEGPRLFARPAREIALLHGEQRHWEDAAIRPGENLLGGLSGRLWHVRAELLPGQARRFGFVVGGVPIVYDIASRRLRGKDREAPVPLENGALEIELLVDRLSVEVFAGQGRVYMPLAAEPVDTAPALELRAEGGAAVARRLEIIEMRSAWPAP